MESIQKEPMNATVAKSFKQYFDNKGIVGPFAEKTVNNFKRITQQVIGDTAEKESLKTRRLYYFTIGHAFKQLSKEVYEKIFVMELDETTRSKKATRYNSLRPDAFRIEKQLEKVLDSLRNINSHYIHEFDKLRTSDNLTPEVCRFLTESFEIACLKQYADSVDISFETLLMEKDTVQSQQKQFVRFLSDRFLPLDSKLDDKIKKEEWYVERQKEKEQFEKQSIVQAINSILFVDVPADFDWELEDGFSNLAIRAGRYLSFLGSLFLIDMFLYKHEASQLISRMKGFKRSDDRKYTYKRDIFTFYAKKVTSEDLHSEEKGLIYFRDMLEYLNKYPVAWNGEMEKTEAEQLTMTNTLINQIRSTEMIRRFGTLALDADFCNFATDYLFKGQLSNVPGKDLYLALINNHPDLKYVYQDVISGKAEQEISTYNFKNPKTYLLKKLLDYNISNSYKLKQVFRVKLEDKVYRQINKAYPINNAIERLKDNITQNSFYRQYGRMQDRFMDFAIRFLAENHYFGSDARFKLYSYYDTQEQEDALAKMTKSEKDSLRYHQGKVVDYRTYTDHLANYPHWDTPFVVEDNAFQYKTSFSVEGQTVEKTVSVQRALLVYLLEHALEQRVMQDAGKHLLTDYFAQLQQDFDNSYSRALADGSEPDSMQRKLLPKRLLNKLAGKEAVSDTTTLQRWLAETRADDARYERLLLQARQVGTELDFLKRNKGKQYKLRFVRKAWNLMYFKERYAQQRANNRDEHHKAYHITKEEYNDFCRYMFAMDEVPRYKDYLTEMMESKGFFSNQEFSDLFTRSKSLDEMYRKTQQHFAQWIDSPEAMPDNSDRYRPENYRHILNSTMVYINLSHFIGQAWPHKADGRILFPVAEANDSYLVDSYYYRPVLPVDEYKIHDKLFNKLRTTRLEDRLLYEIALRYRYAGQELLPAYKQSVGQLLTADIDMPVTDGQGKLQYRLRVPFKKIDTYLGTKAVADRNYEKYKKYGHFLLQLPGYMQRVALFRAYEYKGDSEIKRLNQEFEQTKVLDYATLHKLESHLVVNSLKLTQLCMELEKYYIVDNRVKIPNTKNRIEIKEIPFIKNIVHSVTRNSALHFNVPEGSYMQELVEMEKRFVQHSISRFQPCTFQDLPPAIRTICQLFINALHAEVYKGLIKMKTSEEKRNCRKEGDNNYFRTIIVPLLGKQA